MGPPALTRACLFSLLKGIACPRYPVKKLDSPLVPVYSEAEKAYYHNLI